ncbi:hypothetical protein [Alteromonas sp. 14N.309.X.WAT.G.H12]|uniref:hypothetical protein n=1 Tax=Alteromonas sp. 14N.309.X.WAT.G.H12 TaxID=3120824 RepID=UPI002FCED84A
MTSNLPKLLQNIKKPLGMILHIGAGTGSHLNGLAQLEPRSITLVEASNSLHAQLSRKIKKFHNVVVLKHWVVAAGKITEEANLFSNPRYNSLSKPNDLKSKLPNVNLESVLVVKGKPIDELVNSLELNIDEANILILSVLGYETILIDSLPSEIVEKFEYIIIETPKKVSYEKQWDSDRKIESFISVDLDAYTQDSDDVITYFFKVNHQYINAKNKVFLIQKELDFSKSVIDEIEKKLDEANDLNGQLSSDFQVYKTEAEKEKSDLDEKVEKIILSLKCANKEREELIAKKKSLESDVEKLKLQQTKSRNWAKSLEEEREQLREDKKRLEAELSLSSQNLTSIKSSHSEILRQFTTQEKTLELSVKSNLKLEEENRQLREDIKAKVAQENKLMILIEKLYSALNESNDLLKKLCNEDSTESSQGHSDD